MKLKVKTKIRMSNTSKKVYPFSESQNESKVWQFLVDLQFKCQSIGVRYEHVINNWLVLYAKQNLQIEMRFC